MTTCDLESSRDTSCDPRGEASQSCNYDITDVTHDITGPAPNDITKPDPDDIMEEP